MLLLLTDWSLRFHSFLTRALARGVPFPGGPIFPPADKKREEMERVRTCSTGHSSLMRLSLFPLKLRLSDSILAILFVSPQPVREWFPNHKTSSGFGELSRCFSFRVVKAFLHRAELVGCLHERGGRGVRPPATSIECGSPTHLSPAFLAQTHGVPLQSKGETVQLASLRLVCGGRSTTRSRQSVLGREVRSLF